MRGGGGKARGTPGRYLTRLYPRIHDKGLRPRDWLGNYFQTYLERDERNALNVGDLEAFGRFVRLCAGRSGQLLNLSAMASDCGVTHTTARRWLSVLEARSGAGCLAFAPERGERFGPGRGRAPPLVRP